jgi:O-antigen ligase
VNLTITGGLMIVYAAWLFMRARNRRLLQALVFFSSFSATAVINFSNYGMAPAIVFAGFLFLSKLVSGEALRPVRVGRDFLILNLLVACFAVTSVLSLLINGGLHSLVFMQITQTAYVVFGVGVTLLIAIDFAQPERLEDAIRALRAGAVFIALWGVVQAACFYSGIPYPALLFNNSTSHFADMFDQHANALIRIASVAVEPSFMASSLMIFGTFGATLIITEPGFRTRGWIGSVALVLLVVAASTSTNGYFGLAVLTLLLGLRKPGLTLAIGIGASLIGTIALTLSPSFATAIYFFTFGKASTSSYMDRAQSVADAFNAFLQQPWFGMGWGSMTSFSIVSLMLASVGLVGASIFAAAVIATILSSRAARLSPMAANEWRLRGYAAGAENAMMVYLAQAIVAGFKFVVVDFWCLWALAIAIPSCLVCTCLSGERLRRAQPYQIVQDPGTRRPAAVTKTA